MVKLCLTLRSCMNCSTSGFPVLHHLLEFAPTHVLWVSDAIQPSHPLSPPSPLALNLSQHQGLFQWVGSSCQVAKRLELQLQHQSFQWIFRVDFLQDGLVWSCCPRQWICHPQTKTRSTVVILRSHAQSCKNFQSLHVHIPADGHSFDETARFCRFSSYTVNKSFFWSLFSTTAVCIFVLFIGDFAVYSDLHM